MTSHFAIVPGPGTQVPDPGNSRCSCQRRPSHEQPRCSEALAESVLSHCPPCRAVRMLGLGGKIWGSSSRGRAGHSASCEHWSRPWPREASLPTPSLGGETTPEAESRIYCHGSCTPPTLRRQTGHSDVRTSEDMETCDGWWNQRVVSVTRPSAGSPSVVWTKTWTGDVKTAQ